MPPSPDNRHTAIPNQQRIQSLDGLRALAALAIFFHHVGAESLATFNTSAGSLLARLDVGVPIFFSLSGFLLFRPIVASLLNDGSDGRAIRTDNDPLRKPLPYAWRRIWRIYPAFWVALTLITLTTDEHFGSLGHLASTAGLVHIHWSSHALGPIPQSWSLATEVTFYASLPLFAIALSHLLNRIPKPQTRRNLLFAFTALLYLISVAFRLWVFSTPTGDGWQWRNASLLWLPSLIDYFAIGMALAIAHVAFPPNSPTHQRIQRIATFKGPWWVAAAAIFVLTAQTFGLARGLTWAPWPREIARQCAYGVISFCLLFPLINGGGTLRGAACKLTHRLTTSRALTAAGTISYSFYLWHYAFIAHPFKPWENAVDWLWDSTIRTNTAHTLFGWTTLLDEANTPFVTLTLTALIPTLAVATLSYHLIEKPAIAIGRRF